MVGYHLSEPLKASERPVKRRVLVLRPSRPDPKIGTGSTVGREILVGLAETHRMMRVERDSWQGI
jgi:hypothetical protein